MAADLATLKIRVDALEAKQAERDLDRLSSAGAKAERQAAASGAAWGRFGGLLAGIGLGVLTREFIKTNTEFQRLDAILQTVEGSAQGASVAFAMLEKFAAETPFQLGEVTQAYTQLKARGLDATADSLRAYGDLASAFGKSYETAILGVGQAVTGEFEILKQFGIVARQQGDKVQFTFHGMTETVGRDSKSIEAYLQRLARTSFAGAMQRQMNTLGGAVSNLEDAFQALLRSAGGAGGSDLLVGMVRDLTEWLGRAKAKMDELAQTKAFQEIVVEAGNLAKTIEDLTGDITNLGGALGEAGVKAGAFSGILRTAQTLLITVRALVQGLAVATADYVEEVARDFKNLAQAAVRFPNVARALGISPEAAAEADVFFRGIEQGANQMGTRISENFDAALDSAATRWEQVERDATARAKAAQEAIKRAQGDQSQVGKAGPGGKPPLTAEQVSKIKEAKQALQEWGIETLKTLGLIDEEQEKVAKLTEKIKVLGAAKVEEVKGILQEVEARKQQMKELELASALEARRAAAARQAEEQDRSSAEAIWNLADPYREYRLRLQEINELLDQNLISERQAGIARAEALAAVTSDAKSPEQDKADQLARLNALYRGGALSLQVYKQKVVELGLQGTDAMATLGHAMESVSSNIENAFIQMATTGKFQFKSLVQSILADLARLYAQKAFSQLLQMGLTWLFTPGSGNASGTAEPDYSYFSGRASGGPVTGGTPYLVGERGPELFVPGSSGGIVPNGALGGGIGSVVVNVVVHNEGQATSKVESSEGDGRRVGEGIRGVVIAELLNQMRPGGVLSRGHA